MVRRRKKAWKQERRSSKREKEKKLPISRKVKKIEKQTVVYSSREKFDEITRKKERETERKENINLSLIICLTSSDCLTV